MQKFEEGLFCCNLSIESPYAHKSQSQCQTDKKAHCYQTYSRHLFNFMLYFYVQEWQKCVFPSFPSIEQVCRVFVSYILMVIVQNGTWHKSMTRLHKARGCIHLQTSNVIVLYIFFSLLHKMCLLVGQMKFNLSLKRSKTGSRGFKLSNPGECLQGADLSENHFLQKEARADLRMKTKKKWHSYYPITSLITIICF